FRMAQHVRQGNPEDGQGRGHRLAPPNIRPAPAQQTKQDDQKQGARQQGRQGLFEPRWQTGLRRGPKLPRRRVAEQLLAKEEVLTGPETPFHRTGRILANLLEDLSCELTVAAVLATLLLIIAFFVLQFAKQFRA